jgi:hypothetical protein
VIFLGFNNLKLRKLYAAGLLKSRFFQINQYKLKQSLSQTIIYTLGRTKFIFNANDGVKTLFFTLPAYFVH